MGLPANAQIELAEIDLGPVAEIKPLDIDALETETLRLRPELHEQDMEELITNDQARIAVARTFPKPSLFYRYSYDADSHLYYNQWQQAGIRLTFDLLSVPQKLSEKRETAIAQTINQTRRRAIAAALITQLHLAVIDFQDAAENYRQSSKIATKRALLTEARLRHAKLGDGNHEEVIKSQAKYLLAQSRHLFAYAEWMIAEQRILNTTGQDDIGTPHYIGKNGSASAPEIIAHRKPMADPLKCPDESIQPKKAEKTSPLITIAKPPERIPDEYLGKEAPLPFCLQLASFNSEAEAQRMLADLRKTGLDAFIAKATIPRMGERWRCFVGYYRSAAEARTAKEIHGFSNAIVIKTPYAIHIGNDPAERGQQEMSRKLTSQMLTGASSDRETAEAQAKELSAQGSRARSVQR